MRRNLFLILALSCFLGIAAIFVFQGYMGVWDSVRTRAGEYEQEIPPDYWLRERFFPSTGAAWEGRVSFIYDIENRRFQTYSATVEASVWQENRKIMDLHTQPVSIPSFEKATLEWTLDSKDLQSKGLSPGQYTVRITRDGIERRVLVFFAAPAVPPDKARFPIPAQPVPIPPPTRG